MLWNPQSNSTEVSHKVIGYVSDGKNDKSFLIFRTCKMIKMSIKEEWLRKLWYIYTVEYYYKKEWIWVICNDVDGPWICHTNWSNSETEKQIMYINIYINGIWKNGTAEPTCRAGIEAQRMEKWAQGRTRRVGWIGRVALACKKQWVEAAARLRDFISVMT